MSVRPSVRALLSLLTADPPHHHPSPEQQQMKESFIAFVVDF